VRLSWGASTFLCFFAGSESRRPIQVFTLVVRSNQEISK
jgi:hypothetical protein